MAGQITKDTWVPLGTGVAFVLVIVGAVATIFAWRQEDRERLSEFQNTTAQQLYGIDRKVDGLGHRLDLIEHTNVGRWSVTDMKLWLFKARTKYPDLPDIE